MSNSAILLEAAHGALAETGQEEEAIRLARQIIEHYPDSSEAAMAKGIISQFSTGTNGAATANTEEQWSGARDVNRASASVSSYGTARGLAVFFEFIGWLTVVLGVVLGLMTAKDIGYVGVGAGIAIAFSGLIAIMGAQLIKATVDTADNTRDMLEELRRQRRWSN